MRLIYQIPSITTGLLILTIAVNIFGLRIFTEQGFSVYLQELEQESGVSVANLDLLQAFAKIDKLDPDKQKEYEDIIRELTTVSSALESISKNPNLYSGTGITSSDTGATATSILGFPKSQSPSSYFIEVLSESRNLSGDTPEGRFAIGIIRNILLLNILWLLLIVSGYAIWMRRIFTPIEIVTSNIRKIIDKREYSSTRYGRRDEFTPLVDTINSLQKTLAIQEKIRSNFLSDISHEIRTPITAVKCYIEGIEDGIIKLDSQTILLLQNELSRLASITEKIMEYEHLTHDIFDEIRVERFDVRDILENIIREYSPQLLKTHQSILTSYLSSDTMISMDKSMFIQVLHNIFSNFIKYAGEETKLNIEYDKSIKEYIFHFSDNGKGIPESEIAFVKEKFYRVDKSRTRGEDMSMGIGLSIVDRITKLHHGNMQIESEEGKGVTIRLRIKR